MLEMGIHKQKNIIIAVYIDKEDYDNANAQIAKVSQTATADDNIKVALETFKYLLCDYLGTKNINVEFLGEAQ